MTKNKAKLLVWFLAIGGTIGSLAFGMLTSCWSIRKMLLVFCFASALAIWFFVGSFGSLSVNILIGVLIRGLMNGCIVGLYGLNSTLFETNVRSTGVGLGICVGRLGAILSLIIAGILLDRGWHIAQFYAAAAFVVLLAALAVLALNTSD